MYNVTVLFYFLHKKEQVLNQKYPQFTFVQLNFKAKIIFEVLLFETLLCF